MQVHAVPRNGEVAQWLGVVLPRATLLALLVLVAAALAACGSVPVSGGAPLPGGASGRPALTSEEAQDITIHALGLVGTPYRYGGNTPAGGFDCSGLIGYVYRGRVGVAPPRTVAALARFGAPVRRAELRSGDLVLFGGAHPTHAGIYVGAGRFVHAPSTGGTVRLDRLDAGYWARQQVAFRRP